MGSGNTIIIALCVTVAVLAVVGWVAFHCLNDVVCPPFVYLCGMMWKDRVLLTSSRSLRCE